MYVATNVGSQTFSTQFPLNSTQSAKIQALNDTFCKSYQKNLSHNLNHIITSVSLAACFNSFLEKRFSGGRCGKVTLADPLWVTAARLVSNGIPSLLLEKIKPSWFKILIKENCDLDVDTFRLNGFEDF